MSSRIKALQASARAHTQAICAQLERLEKRWAAPQPASVRKAADVVLFQAARPPAPIRKVVSDRTAEDDLWREATRLVETGACPDLATAVDTVCKAHPRVYAQHVEERAAAQRARAQPGQPTAVQKAPLVPVPYPSAPPALSQFEQLMRQVQDAHPDWSQDQIMCAVVQTGEGSRAWAQYRMQHLYPRQA